jgi:GntR family transcriptional regulator / MocR family aminotransferase
VNGSGGTRQLFVEFEPRRGALRRNLCEALRAAIQQGRLSAGMQLPSSRGLAAELAVSRGVVTDAYDQLVSEGYIAVRPRSGHVVASVASSPPPAVESAPRAVRFDLIATTPEVGLFPRHAWLRAVERALRETPDAALDYSDRRGRIELRTALGPYLARVRGVRVDPARIVVTQGFTQGLYLICRTLAARGATTVAFETPSLPELWITVRAAGLELVGCPVDAEGLRVEDLAGLRADAVVVTPAHQYPMGAVLTPARRAALLAWAAETGGIIIEDDYDAEFRYDRTPVGSIQGRDPDRVVHIGTASKTLAPGVRLGWMSVPAALLEDVRAAKMSMDHGSPAIDQIALAHLLANGVYERHVARVRQVYRRRRDLLVRAIAAGRPDLGLRGITAGTHALLPLGEGVDDTGIARAAAAEGIRVRDLTSQRLVPEPERGLVLGFGRLPDGHIDAALEAVLGLIPTARAPGWSRRPEARIHGLPSTRRTTGRVS